MIRVLDSLRAGRERIARGWCQHDFARNAEGGAADAVSPEAVTWCAYGASFSFYSDKALEVAAATFGVSDKNLAKWNDEPHRTQADVLALYDRAIELAEKGEV